MAKVQNAKNIAESFNTLNNARTLQMTDRRQTDLRQQRPEHNLVTFG